MRGDPGLLPWLLAHAAVFLVQSLLLSQRGAEPSALPSAREHFRPPGHFGIHGGRPAVRVRGSSVLLLLLPVEGVRPRASRVGTLSPHEPCEKGNRQKR